MAIRSVMCGAASQTDGRLDFLGARLLSRKHAERIFEVLDNGFQ